METKIIAKVGFYAGILTAVLTLITWGIAIFTPPLSGPYCVAGAGCYSYPFADIASRFPRDYYWMYPAILMALAFYVVIVSIHYFAPAEKKIYSYIGVSFALIAMAT